MGSQGGWRGENGDGPRRCEGTDAKKRDAMQPTRGSNSCVRLEVFVVRPAAIATGERLQQVDSDWALLGMCTDRMWGKWDSERNHSNNIPRLPLHRGDEPLGW